MTGRENKSLPVRRSTWNDLRQAVSVGHLSHATFLKGRKEHKI